MTHFDPDHFKSQYNNDFLAFPVEPRGPLRPDNNALPKTPFVGTTTYRDMLSAKPIEKKPAKYGPPPLKPTAPFDGHTTHKDFFHAYPDSRPRDSMAPAAVPLHSAPFDGSTSYKHEYVPHDTLSPYKHNSDPFDYEYGPPRNLSTEHQAAYTKKIAPHCPVFDLFPKDPSNTTGHIHYTKSRRPEFKFFPGRTDPFSETGKNQS